MSYADLLAHYFPGTSWLMNGDEYEGIVWSDSNVTKPTKTELDALAWPPAPSTDPSDYPLLPWQFKALVDYLGKDTAIKTAVSSMPAGLARSAALSRYQNASSYRFDDPLLQQIRAAINMPVQTLTDAWMQAKDLTST